MRVVAAACVAVALASACGNDEKEDDFGSGMVSVAPPPGAYPFTVWSVVSVKVSDLSGARVMVRRTQDTEFTDVTAVQSTPREPHGLCGSDNETRRFCLENTASGAFSYYVESTDGSKKGAETEVAYTVAPMAANLSAEVAEDPAAAAIAFAIAGKETFCALSDSDAQSGKLQVFMKGTPDGRQAPGAFVVTFFRVAPPTGVPADAEIANHDAGIQVYSSQKVNNSTSFPVLADNVDYLSFVTGREEDGFPSSNCSVTFESYELGREAGGTVTCTNLRALSQPIPSAVDLGGTSVSFSGSWHCDRWLGSTLGFDVPNP